MLNVLENHSRVSPSHVKITCAIMPRSARPCDGAFSTCVGRDDPLGMGGSKDLGDRIGVLYWKSPLFQNGGPFQVGSGLPSYQMCLKTSVGLDYHA